MLEVVAVPEATKQSILHVFDPLIDLMIDLALPIAGVMITGGALLIMIGQKDKGFSLIMNSSTWLLPGESLRLYFYLYWRV